MVPTAALLRFGLHDAKGRRPHPLCNDLPESALSSETIAASPSRSSTQSKVGLTMKKVRTCHNTGHFLITNSLNLLIGICVYRQFPSYLAVVRLLVPTTPWRRLLRLLLTICWKTWLVSVIWFRCSLFKCK